MKNTSIRQDSLRPKRKLFRRGVSSWGLLALMIPMLLLNGCSKEEKESGYPLVAAKNFTATPGNGQAVLKWSAAQSEHVKSYEVTWTPADGAGKMTVTTGTECTALNLKNDTEYTFSLYAMYDLGKSEAVTVKATPKADAINYTPCTEVTAKPGDKMVALGWKTPAPVERAELKGFTIDVSPRDVQPVTVNNPAATSFDIAGLTNGTKYTLKIIANYDSGNSVGVTVFSTPEAPDLNEYLQIDPASVRNMTMTDKGNSEYEFTTTSGDPYAQTKTFKKDNGAESVVLSFECKTSQEIPNVQIFFSPIAEDRSVRGLTIPASSDWKVWSLVLKKELADFKWTGKVGENVRIDFGERSGVKFGIRKIHFREMNAEELKKWQEEEERRKSELAFENNLKDYLAKSFSGKVNNVSVTADKVTIQGNFSGSGSFSLAEIPVYDDVLKITKFTNKTALTASPFTVTLDRVVRRDELDYDRLLSKWVVVKTGNDKDELVSSARYADDINAPQSPPAVKPASKKGLGGFFKNAFESDLDDLGITSVTVNLVLNTFISTTPDGNTVEHTYGGKTYYMRNSVINEMDNSLKACQQRNIVVSAILLVAIEDSEAGRLLRHPNYAKPGIYSMPNMTTPQSVNCYAAVLDFIAKRYCAVGSPNGRIHHWILHNEVDMGTEWTNMGNPMVNTYMDTYVKSLRMCYNIARKYDKNTQVLGSFTHSWAAAAGANGHTSYEMINILKGFSKAEGDFQWGLAYHPYPENLLEPKTWLDKNATYSMNTPYVTFKNLEVLSKWAMDRSNWYRDGALKRTIWLSENGTNSPSYSDKDLAEQAAGFAWAWKKIKALDGIDGIQWHNWIDNKAEYGLRIGLRRYSDAPDNGAPKPVWYLYQAAGTAAEDEKFEPSLKVIGISDWNIIRTVN